MKIAVFGWYGHHNAGDERIRYCLDSFLRELGGIDRVDFFDLHEEAIRGRTQRFDGYDLVIIGGGGLILSQNNYHDFILGINTKVITLGVSIERPRLVGNVKKFASSLLAKSLVVIVRDAESAQKLAPLDKFNKVRVSSDLTFLKPYDEVPESHENLMGVNLLPKLRDFKYSTLSLKSFSFLSRQLSRLCIENVIRIIDFSPLIQMLREKFNLLPIPLYCGVQNMRTPLYQQNDVEFLKRYFSQVPENFSHHRIDACSLFLSMRLHGSIFAVQKGVPVLSFSYLPKNRNFMREAGLEHWVMDTQCPVDLNRYLDDVGKNKNTVREKMRAYTEQATQRIRKEVVDVLNLVR